MIAQIGTFYRGWSMVALGMVISAIVVGATSYSFGILVIPVSQELHLPRAMINSGLICLYLGNAVLTPIAGRLLDRFSIRLLLAVSAVLLGGSFITMSIGDNLWLKGILLAGPIAFSMAAGGILACYVLIARWFHVHRGRAMAIVAMGQSASSILYAPAFGYCVQLFGWRQALFFEGIFVFVVLLLASRLIGDAPGINDHEPGSNRSESAEEKLVRIGQPIRVASVLKTPIFWVLTIIIGLMLAVIQSVLATMVPLFTSRGYSIVQATSLVSMLGISAVVGKFVLAIVADRANRVALLAGCVILTLCFTLSLTQDRGYLFAISTSLTCGVALSTFYPIYSAVLAERFGAHSLGTVQGLMAPFIASLSAVAIYFAGASYDKTKSYDVTFLTFAGILGAVLVLTVSLLLYRPKQSPVAVP